jgi:hypothetical protein
MSDSTSLLTQLSSSQGSKEITVNELFNSTSPVTYGGKRQSSAGLSWDIFGIRYNGTAVANATVTLTASTTNYVVANRSTGAFSVSTATTNWNDIGRFARCYKIVTGTATVTSYEDHRHGIGGLYGIQRSLQEIAFSASITPDALSGKNVVVGTLTGNITINAPTNPYIGAEMLFSFTQDSTGARTVTWNSVFKKGTDGVGTANQKTAIQFFYDGSNWVALSQLSLSWL